MEKTNISFDLQPTMDGNSNFDFETTKVLVSETTRIASLIDREADEPSPTPRELNEEYWPFMKKSR